MPDYDRMVAQADLDDDDYAEGCLLIANLVMLRHSAMLFVVTNFFIGGVLLFET
jgi:hypothetical protein